MKINAMHHGTLILGMGNKFFGDDGVGIIIAEQLRGILKKQKSIFVEETNWGGFRIIDLLSGHKNAIIIDALKTGIKPVGYIHRLDYKDLIHSVRMVSFHDINFATAVEFARKINIPMPDNISVYAIEVESTDHFSDKLSPKVHEASDKCIAMVLKELGETIQTKLNKYEVIA